MIRSGIKLRVSSPAGNNIGSGLGLGFDFVFGLGVGI